jgi:putative membrane protein
MEDFRTYLQRKPNEALGKKLKITAWILTAAVLVLVGLMRRPELRIPLPEGFSFSFLPPVHAVINTIVSIALVVALVGIKKKNIQLHTRAIGVAMGMSVLFLLCYVCYHFTTEEVRYGGEGVMRSVYFFFLITHIVLAGVSLPFILFTWINGFTNQFAKHKKLARWVFPMWLYVAVTGPICYLLLKPYY